MLIKKNVGFYIFTIFTLWALFFASTASSQEQERIGFDKPRSHWTFFSGYGVTHKGLGDTRTRVETVDFILQYGYFLSKEVGKSWYRGRHEILIEIPFYFVTHPETAFMTGMNFMACWNFTASERIIPYVFAGGGPVYTNLDISGLGSEFNGNYQAGVGLNYFMGVSP